MGEGRCGCMWLREGGGSGGGGEKVALHPPFTHCAGAHSVIKGLVSRRPCPNNDSIQREEESVSRRG